MAIQSLLPALTLVKISRFVDYQYGEMLSMKTIWIHTTELVNFIACIYCIGIFNIIYRTYILRPTGIYLPTNLCSIPSFLSIRQSFLSIHPSVYWPTHPSTRPSILPSIHPLPSIHQSINHTINRSNDQSMHPMPPFIHPSTSLITGIKYKKKFF